MPWSHIRGGTSNKRTFTCFPGFKLRTGLGVKGNCVKVTRTQSSFSRGVLAVFKKGCQVSRNRYGFLSVCGVLEQASVLQPVA